MGELEQNNILDLIRLNSGIQKNQLNISEDTNSYDIAQTDTLIDGIIKEKYNNSLCYQVCDVRPLSGSFGKVFAQVRKPGTTNFEIISKDAQPTLQEIKSGYTIEVLQDIQNMFSLNASNSVGLTLGGLSDLKENIKLIDYINTESTIKSELVLVDAQNPESIILQISKKVAESVIEMNEESYKTLNSFCILPPIYAAAVLGSFNYMTEGLERSLFVGKIGRTNFYINPIPKTHSQFNDDFNIDYETEDLTILDFCYVGLMSPVPGNSSLIFTPYDYNVVSAQDPDTGDYTLFVKNRNDLLASPLHRPLEKMSLLHKFSIRS